MSSGGPFTILFSPASNVLFHVGRCAALADELAKRGHRTILAGVPRYLRDPAVAEESSRFVALPDFDPDTGMELLRSITRVPDQALVDRLVDAETVTLQKIRPDVVVTDFRPTMTISARSCGIPLVALLLSHWMPGYAADPEWVPRTYTLGLLARRLFGERIGRCIASPIFRQIIRHKTGPFRAAARARGQAAPSMLWEYLQGDLNLLSDTDLLDIPLPEATHRVGPILWTPNVALPHALLEVEEGLPVVYVTCGSTGNAELFSRIFEELADGPWQVVVSTGGQVDPPRSGLPANFIVERLVPGLAIMRIADLVVYHGGAGTFQHALREGVPGIVIATHWDQEYTGYVCEREGLGVFLTLREVLSHRGRLRDVTAQTLADRAAYRARLSSVRDDAFQTDGTKAAADHIEAFLRARAC
jgi:UDP:flavonoid glycosyltransferase YjiC (YdhE family)